MEQEIINNAKKSNDAEAFYGCLVNKISQNESEMKGNKRNI